MTILTSLLLVAAVALLPAAASAQASNPQDRFNSADLDGDGALSSQEFSSARAGMFDKIDGNGDGMITEAEAIAFAQGRSDMRAKKRFAKADADADGVVQRSEFEQVRDERQARLFSRLDADGDGFVTLDEIRDARRQRQNRN